jgi:hypothetical protein
MPTGGFDAREWGALIDELAAARDSSIAFFDGLPADAWDPFRVRALAWLTAGHAAHHTRIVRERYLPALT